MLLTISGIAPARRRFPSYDDIALTGGDIKE